MQTMQVEQTQVDRCTACEGLWFDALEDRDVHAKASIDLLVLRAPSPRRVATSSAAWIVLAATHR